MGAQSPGNTLEWATGSDLHFGKKARTPEVHPIAQALWVGRDGGWREAGKCWGLEELLESGEGRRSCEKWLVKRSEPDSAGG